MTPLPRPDDAPRHPRVPWLLVGEVAGWLGLALSYVVSNLMRMRLSPVTAMEELIIDHSPGWLANWAKETLGHADKPVTIAGILVVLTLAFAGIGLLWRIRPAAGVIGFAVLALPGVVAVMSENGAKVSDVVPLVVGFVAWLVAAAVLCEQLRAVERSTPSDDPDGQTRRTFLTALGAVAALAGVSGIAGRWAGAARREVEQERSALELPGRRPALPEDVQVDLPGVARWQTPNGDFYLIDTAAVKPAIRNRDWELRVHGMVEREVRLSFDDLIARPVLEEWITLNCVSNEVGGNLIGNAWWTGTSLAGLIREAGPLAGADALLQTSEDGWTCGTPLTTVLDGRNAMLAYAMNGAPLPIDHGYPVRAVVPGLYGYVSATKWVVDIEVTRFSDFSAFWTDRGWSEQGPVRLASRIDVPRSGATRHAAEGRTVFGGSAWCQHTGVAAVEVQIDGGAWSTAELARVPSSDTWVQWQAELPVSSGRHTVRVRATDADGNVQTPVRRAPAPDGATGWHTVDFEVS